MRKSGRNFLLGAGVVAVVLAAGLAALALRRTPVNPRVILASLAQAMPPGPVAIAYPLEGTLFPPEISAPAFRWKDSDGRADLWLISIAFADGRKHLHVFAPQPKWRPERAVWEKIKRRSRKTPAVMTIIGVNRQAPSQALSVGHVTIRTSSDPVGAPLFYREVNLPFVDAVKDPSTIRWRFGALSSVERPPVVLENLPVCGNCHSFSADGAVLGMDVDYANDKGSYAIAPIRPSMTLDKSRIITWSPDGKSIVFAATEAYTLLARRGTRKVLLNPEECREFLEGKKPFQFNLYRLPFNGGQGGKPEPLVGASFNGKSNFFPKYSPDGKWIVFCQARNYMLLQPDSELYIIPGEGGEARRLRANTSRMNSWHSFSPNGKWLVFSGKPDSPYTRLYLTHIDENGESTPAVVLDHLTAPDRAANIPEFVSAPPAAIRHIREQFVDDVSYARAAHEYFKANDYENMERQARKALARNPKNAEALHYLGLALFGREQPEEAIRCLSEAARVKPQAGEVQVALGAILIAQNRFAEGIHHLRRALELTPDSPEAYFNLGVAAFRQGNRSEAVKCWLRAAELKPDDFAAHYNLALAFEVQGQAAEAIEHYRKAAQAKPNDGVVLSRLGNALCAHGAVEEGLAHLSNAVTLDRANHAIRCNLALMLARLQRHDQAIVEFQWILRLDPRHTDALVGLAASYAETARMDKALESLEQALLIAQSTGNQKLAQQIAKRIDIYRQRLQTKDK